MPSFYFFENAVPISSEKSLDWTYYNLVHNRMNLSLRPLENLKLDIGMRNRFLAGGFLNNIPQYADVLSIDNGIADLSWNLYNKGGAALNTSLDRLYIDYTINNVQIKIGRQRVNWGIGLVWNPDDIFNVFSYIDFDYEERPGSDAVSLTWYKSPTSSLDLVYKADRNPADSIFRHTAAARYLFNVRNYDIQFLAGLSNDDLVAGFGWSGAIKNVSFRGEMSLFAPVAAGNTNSATAISATVEADYTFASSMYIHAAALFNSSGKMNTSEGMNLLAVQNDLSARKLSYGKIEIFAQASYPFSPVFNAGLAAMLNPADLSAYISPNFTLSLADNIELALVSQLLVGRANSEYAASGNIYAAFARLKWSF
jgi:hypothetical protein